MNDTSRKISPLRQRMIEEMRMRQLAPKTRDIVAQSLSNSPTDVQQLAPMPTVCP